MSLLQLTLKLYVDSLKDAGRAWVRTAWAIVVLVGFWLLMNLAIFLLAPMGIAGGFVLFLVSSALTGTYLSMVEVGVTGARVLRPGDLRNHAGQHLQIVIAVSFVFWIPTILIQVAMPPEAWLVLSTTAAVVFNPVPEMVYIDRHEGGLAILGDALNFMQRNWPEWLVAFVLVTAPYLALWGALTQSVSIEMMGLAFSTFGPFFGFVEGGAGVVMWGPMAGLSLVFAPLVHFVMIFRGQLYKRLRLSNRRQRAWQAKF